MLKEDKGTIRLDLIKHMRPSLILQDLQFNNQSDKQIEALLEKELVVWQKFKEEEIHETLKVRTEKILEAYRAERNLVDVKKKFGEDKAKYL